MFLLGFFWVSSGLCFFPLKIFSHRFSLLPPLFFFLHCSSSSSVWVVHRRGVGRREIFQWHRRVLIVYDGVGCVAGGVGGDFLFHVGPSLQKKQLDHQPHYFPRLRMGEFPSRCFYWFLLVLLHLLVFVNAFVPCTVQLD